MSSFKTAAQILVLLALPAIAAASPEAPTTDVDEAAVAEPNTLPVPPEHDPHKFLRTHNCTMEVQPSFQGQRLRPPPVPALRQHTKPMTWTSTTRLRLVERPVPFR